MPQNNKHKGFSIIEAVLLLLIIAVIASTALPKISGSLDRNSVSVASTAGEFDSAVKLARAQWFSNGQGGSGRIKGFADGHVWSGKRGWPVGHRGSRAPTKTSASHCASLWNGVMQGPEAPRSATDGSEEWQARNGSRSGECQYITQRDGVERIIRYSSLSGKVNYL